MATVRSCPAWQDVCAPVTQNERVATSHCDHSTGIWLAAGMPPRFYFSKQKAQGLSFASQSHVLSLPLLEVLCRGLPAFSSADAEQKKCGGNVHNG